MQDARPARPGKFDSQRHIAFEPALTTARPHHGHDQQGDHDKDERAGNETRERLMASLFLFGEP